MGLVALWHVGSSRTRDWTGVPCIDRQTLNYQIIMEVQFSVFKCIFPLSKTSITLELVFKTTDYSFLLLLILTLLGWTRKRGKNLLNWLKLLTAMLSGEKFSEGINLKEINLKYCILFMLGSTLYHLYVSFFFSCPLFETVKI